MPDAPAAQDGALAALQADAREIFHFALEACRIERMLPERIACDGEHLVIRPPVWAREVPLSIPLARFRSVLLIAIGKAAVPLTRGMLRVLPDSLLVRGLCVAPERPVTRPPRLPNRRIAWLTGGHPVPNRHSFRAARLALRLLEQADEHTLVLFLVSGGGSALLELPLDPAITLEDMVAFHRALVHSGATIAEINTLRKHVSAVKGGRLALTAKGATKLTLSVLDVPTAQLDALASGPTVPDSTTVADCREILRRYGLLAQFPPAVQAFFARADLPETPGAKSSALAGPGENADARGVNWNVPLLANEDLVHAARKRAEALGYEVVIDSDCDDWPYDQASRYLLHRLVALRRERPEHKLCLLSGGEVTVAIDGDVGTGGRNQQFALAAALALERNFAGERIVCLSAGSDGVDGNSPAAGAVVDTETARRARSLGLSPEESLAHFDAFRLLQSVESAVQTSPTHNNLRDLRVCLYVPTAI